MIQGIMMELLAKTGQAALAALEASPDASPEVKALAQRVSETLGEAKTVVQSQEAAAALGDLQSQIDSKMAAMNAEADELAAKLGDEPGG